MCVMQRRLGYFGVLLAVALQLVAHYNGGADAFVHEVGRTDDDISLNQIARPYAASSIQADTEAELEELLHRDPNFLVDVLSKMRSQLRLPRPVQNTKRGIDFGLGRGFSGSQAAKHFMGMAAARFSGGPGKRRKRFEN